MLKAKLQARKQQVVRDAIYESAIELFTVKGFDEITIEEIAAASGVSRRTFFHYYASKDDLLAQSVVSYGAAIVDAIAACPSTLTPFETVRATVLSAARHTEADPFTRKIIEISQRSVAATKAHASRFVEVEDRVSMAYARRFAKATKYDLKPRLLAYMTISVLNASIINWSINQDRDLLSSAEKALSCLTQLFDTAPAPARKVTPINRRSAKSSSPRKSTRR
jgi:AcrR family transcriptional regulator